MQQAEGLGDHVGTVGGNDDFVVDAGSGFLRYLAQDGQRGVAFDVHLGTELRVEEADAKHNQCRYGQSEDNGDEGDHHQAGAGEVDDGGFHHLGVRHGDGQVHGGLLAFAQQVEVEFLFDFLLTGDLGDGLGLRGHGGNLAAGAGLLVAGILQAHARSINKVADGSIDGAQLVVHLAFQSLHLGVVGTGGGLQAFVAAHEGVVRIDHTLDAYVADSHVDGNELLFVDRVGDVVFDVADERHLGLQAHHLVGVALTLLQQLGVGTGHFAQARSALDVLHLGVHHIQFAGYEADTLRDEGLGLLGHFVLVLEGVVVVDGNQGVHNLVGTLAVAVVVGDGNDGGHLVDTRNVERLQHAAGHGHRRADSHLEVHVLEFVGVELGLLDGERQGVVEFHRLAVVGLEGLALLAVFLGAVFILVVGQGLDADVESHVAVGLLAVVEGQRQRGVLEIAYFFEHVVARAGVVQPQAVHHLVHQPRRLEHVDFVLEREVGVVHAHVAQNLVHVPRLVAHVVAFVAHQNGAGGRPGLGLRFVVEACDDEADHNRNDKPPPVVQYQKDKVADGERFLVLAVATVVLNLSVVCIIHFSINIVYACWFPLVG